MEVLFTPAARSQLLQLVADLGRDDRPAAARLVDAVAEKLQALAAGSDEGQPVKPTAHAIAGAGGLRLCYWVRAGALWVLAIHPADPTPLGAFSG